MPITFEPFDWYETPRYYDMVFDADTPQEADFLARVHDLYGRSKGRRAIEPACGSGRLLKAMQTRGYDVTGFDLSEGMLAFARTRCPDVPVFQASMQDFQVKGRFDLAFNLVSTFKYLLTEEDAAAHLNRMADVLKPGGVYALGLHLTDYSDRQKNRERWVVEVDGVHVVCNIQGWPADRKARTEAIRSRLIVTRGEDVRRYETNWTFRTYDAGQLRALLQQAPELEHVATYGFDCNIDKPHTLDGDRLDQLLILRRV